MNKKLNTANRMETLSRKVNMVHQKKRAALGEGPPGVG